MESVFHSVILCDTLHGVCSESLGCLVMGTGFVRCVRPGSIFVFRGFILIETVGCISLCECFVVSWEIS